MPGDVRILLAIIAVVHCVAIREYQWLGDGTVHRSVVQCSAVQRSAAQSKCSAAHGNHRASTSAARAC